MEVFAHLKQDCDFAKLSPSQETRILFVKAEFSATTIQAVDLERGAPVLHDPGLVEQKALAKKDSSYDSQAWD